MKSDIGLIGLAVMGQNLVLNMESKGYKVSVYNRSRGLLKSSWRERPRVRRILSLHIL